MTKTSIGLEITQTAVRAVEVKLGDRPALVRYGTVDLPVGAAHDSEVIDAGIVSDALRELWSTAGFSNRKPVLGINSWRVLVRDFSTALTDPALITESLPVEVGELLPVSPEQAALDFVPTAVDEEGTSGLLVAANAASIDALLGALTAARLHAASVDLVPFGLVRLAGALAPDETVVMVHLGRHTTATALVAGGVPAFVRMLPAELLPPPPDDDVPVQTGPRFDRRRETRRAELDQARREAADDLGARLRSTLQYYASRDAPRPTRIVLSGAGATDPLVKAVLHDALEAPVEVLDPLTVVRLRGRGRSIPPALLHELIGAIGLTVGADA